MYLIDTLGERLYEGNRRAYVLCFNGEDGARASASAVPPLAGRPAPGRSRGAGSCLLVDRSAVGNGRPERATRRRHRSRRPRGHGDGGAVHPGLRGGGAAGSARRGPQGERSTPTHGHTPGLLRAEEASWARLLSAGAAAPPAVRRPEALRGGGPGAPHAADADRVPLRPAGLRLCCGWTACPRTSSGGRRGQTVHRRRGGGRGSLLPRCRRCQSWRPACVRPDPLAFSGISSVHRKGEAGIQRSMDRK